MCITDFCEKAKKDEKEACDGAFVAQESRDCQLIKISGSIPSSSEPQCRNVLGQDT